ncbi:MAG TPA: alkaline phosphatase D family protein [Dehalococcoidia bacterium]|nr:alkaline phosphatase D family protein [Dehalococcoidia bacterium]
MIGAPALRARVRLAARLLALFAAVVFSALAIDQGPPVRPEGPGIERDIQYVFVIVGVLSSMLAWRWSLPGGALLVLTGAVLGVAAAGRYSTDTALGVALMFVLPGLLFLAVWSWTRGILAQAGSLAFVLILMAYAGVRAEDRHKLAFGPAHPSSPLVAKPIDLVEWVWSGGVTSRGAVVKARLAAVHGNARLLVSTSETLTSPRYVDQTKAATDGVVWFNISGLDPSTTYHYAVEVDTRVDQGRRGRFQTFPEGASSFTFAVAACARTGSNGAVFDAIRGENALLYVVTGDFHYENIVQDSRSSFARAYNRNLTAPAAAALYAQTPIAYTWDDHDFGGNNSDASSAAKEAARLSYREFVPHYDLPAGEGNNPIYQAFSVGRVRFVMSDTRSMKNAEKTSGGSDSMLGQAQLRWLKSELKSASRTHGLVVWVSSVPWIAPASGARDDWGGYADERREIADFIAENRIDNLLMLAGDAHMVAIDDGTNSDYSTAKKGGFPILHAGALDRPGSEKGGPYSEGEFPGAGQYGLVTVQDDGRSMTITLKGKTWEGKELVSYTFQPQGPLD